MDDTPTPPAAALSVPPSDNGPVLQAFKDVILSHMNTADFQLSLNELEENSEFESQSIRAELRRKDNTSFGMPVTFWDALRHLQGDVNAAREYAEAHWEHVVDAEARSDYAVDAEARFEHVADVEPPRSEPIVEAEARSEHVADVEPPRSEPIVEAEARSEHVVDAEPHSE